jgi:hypothetical protein
MAEEWFGVRREEDRLQVLALVAQRIFPTSLCSLYRVHRLAREAAEEALKHHLPDVADEARSSIAERLVEGYWDHDHSIGRAEARALGLRVAAASPEQERLLWDLSKACGQTLVESPGHPGVEGTTGLIMSAEFRARRVQRWIDEPTSDGDGGNRWSGAPRSARPVVTWEIDGASGGKRWL